MEHFSKENIKIDLHIHSSISEKWDGDVVKNSNDSNTHVLIENLENNGVNLFSVTDHNAFDYKLYDKLKQSIKSSKVIKNILPGIEFNVALEEGHPDCHIIAIFEDKNQSKLSIIQELINKNYQIEPGQYYTLDEFENLLKHIGLNALLIVHQKHDFDVEEKTKSMSESCSQPSVFIKTGFFNCLEYSNNKSEGVVKKCLRDIDCKIPLITGSDCHDWNYYPMRDQHSKGNEIFFSEFRCLPTFKGLLMAFSSFNTRANYKENEVSRYIETLNIGSTKIPLSKGLNAIIGDNGCGKTMLLNLFASNKVSEYSALVKKNKLSCNYNVSDFNIADIKHIEQGEINLKVLKGNLFEGGSEYYDDVPSTENFKNSIINYFDKLDSYIKHNIHLSKGLDIIKCTKINFDEIKEDLYYPVIISDIDIDDIDEICNFKNSIKLQLDAIVYGYLNNLNYLKSMSIDNEYFLVINNLLNVYNKICTDYYYKNLNNKVKGLIAKHLKSLINVIKNYRTTKDKITIDKLKNRENLSSCIVAQCKLINKTVNFPNFPVKIDGISSKQVNDYAFIKVAAFHDKDLKNEFYKFCFNNGYQNEESIKNIQTYDEYIKALDGISSKEGIEKFKALKIIKFIDNYCSFKTSISQISSGATVGNTPGENALVYYKFLADQDKNEYSILLIDQPEDDINPKNINKLLNMYISDLRWSKQVILATHNPLLVVNLDVDNVLYLHKEDDNISVKYGALEYDIDYNILDYIKDNLDGGLEAIEKRIRVYDRT